MGYLPGHCPQQRLSLCQKQWSQVNECKAGLCRGGPCYWCPLVGPKAYKPCLFYPYWFPVSAINSALASRIRKGLTGPVKPLSKQHNASLPPCNR